MRRTPHCVWGKYSYRIDWLQNWYVYKDYLEFLFWHSCLCFLSLEITGVSHHNPFYTVWWFYTMVQLELQASYILGKNTTNWATERRLVHDSIAWQFCVYLVDIGTIYTSKIIIAQRPIFIIFFLLLIWHLLTFLWFWYHNKLLETWTS